MKQITIYTDGSCLGNANGGPGGWSAIIVGEGFEIKLGKGYYSTTNNRMEILAVIEPLATLTTPHHVNIHTDSQYTIDGATKWIKGWVKRGWKRRDEGDVKNRDLWEEIMDVMRMHKVTFTKVKGHSGDHYNEMADVHAKKMANTPTLHDVEYERLAAINAA